MSYPQDIDEMRLTVIRKELQHRLAMVLTGRCSYCSRRWGTSPCKEVNRHDPKRAVRHWQAERRRRAAWQNRRPMPTSRPVD